MIFVDMPCPNCKDDACLWNNPQTDVVTCNQCDAHFSMDYLVFLDCSKDVKYPNCPKCKIGGVEHQVGKRNYMCQECGYSIKEIFLMRDINNWKPKEDF